MGCNCSKKSRVRHIVKTTDDKQEETQEQQKSRLSVLKDMWEAAKKGENEDNKQ